MLARVPGEFFWLLTLCFEVYSFKPLCPVLSETAHGSAVMTAHGGAFMTAHGGAA